MLAFTASFQAVANSAWLGRSGIGRRSGGLPEKSPGAAAAPDEVIRSTTSLVLDGSRSVLVRTGEDIVDVVRQGQGVLNIVPLAGLVEQLAASIHEIAPIAENGSEASGAPARRGRKASAGGGG